MPTYVASPGASASPLSILSPGGTASGNFYWNLSGIPTGSTVLSAAVTYEMSGNVVDVEPGVIQDTHGVYELCISTVSDIPWNSTGLAWITSNLGSANASGSYFRADFGETHGQDIAIFQLALEVEYLASSGTCYETTLVVQVIDGCYGNPISGASVITGSSTGTTGLGGFTTFTGLATGTHQYSVTYGGVTASGSFAANCGGGTVFRQLTVTPSGGCTTGTCSLTFAVYDVVTMSPVSGAVVALDGGATSSATNASGVVVFAGSTNVVRDIQITKSGYQTYSLSGSCSGECSAAAYGGIFIPLHSNFAPNPSGHATPVVTSMPVLQEDGNGVVPISVSYTDDRTPTASWTVTGGTPDYRHLWRLYWWNGSSYTFQSSGATNRSNVTLNTSGAGRYQLLLQVQDSTGEGSPYATNCIYIPSTYEGAGCVDCVDSAARVAYPTMLSGTVGGNDLTVLSGDVTDIIRYYPRWMDIYGEGATGTTLYRVWRPILGHLMRATKDLEVAANQRNILSIPVNSPRLVWTLQTKFTPRDPLPGLYVASGSASGTIRQATSLRDLLQAWEPVMMLDDCGLVVFRNIARKQQTVVGTGTFVVTGETRGFVPDADILLTSGGVHYRIAAGSTGVDYRQSTIYLPSTWAGSLTVTFQSQDVVVSGATVSLSGEPHRTPSPVDLWNAFDKAAAVVSLTRRPDESNNSLRLRTYGRLLSGPGDDVDRATHHIAQDLGRHHILRWDGRTTLSLQSSGYYGIKLATVINVPEIESASEQMTKQSSGIFRSSKTDWLEGALVWVDGALVDSIRFPSYQQSGNVVVGLDVTGTVTAQYRYRNYNLTRTALQTITTITPSSNLPSGDYLVLLTRDVLGRTPLEGGYLQQELLDGDGLPTPLLEGVVDSVLQSSPIHAGSARWGVSSYWQDPREAGEATYLPGVFDVGT